MASIMKKVFHPGTWRQNSRKGNVLSPPGADKPVCPPSPDLTGLTPEEIKILKDVFKRQELFEAEEQKRQRKLADELLHFQEQVKKQESLKGKFKHVELRLCRLCYKTKFADGIGKACYECHKRVCNRCGSYLRPEWNPKKNKNVKGKWICNMCLMKRELLAKTGTWYHGPNAQPSINSHSFCKKLSFSEIESSENDGTGTDATFSEGTQTQAFSDYDYRRLDLVLRTPMSPGKRSRRYHSYGERDPIEPDEDLEIDDEQFHKERQICRRQRYSRKSRRSLTSTNSFSEKDKDSYGLKEAAVKVVLKYPNEESSWLSHPDSKIENQNFLYLSSDSVPLFTESSASDSRRVSWESTCTESSGQRRGSRDDEAYSDESRHDIQVCDLNVSEIKRQDALYFSSSSSILSDTKCSDSIGHSSPSPVSNVSRLDLTPPRASASRITNNEKVLKPKFLPHQSRIDDVRESSPAQINSLSPDIALSCHQHHRRHRSHKVPSQAECQKRERQRHHACQNYNEILRSQMGRQELMLNRDGRRMTLPHCANIQLHTMDRRMSSGNVTNTREIILHRDKNDKSNRTAGLGMRVVGGKIGTDGLTGAYVTMVTENGPAYTQGIRSGDQVLQWDGRSFNDVTFEEVNEIKNTSGSIVHIVVFCHHNEIIAQVNQERTTYPVIIRSETTDVKDLQPPVGLSINKPKRRLLPKTPIEIKRDVKQINGKIWLQIDYDTKCACLAVTLVKGESLLSAEGDERRGINPVVMLHLLPSRNVHESKETKPKFDTTDPEWNETFVFPNITEEEVGKKSLEITLWSIKEIEDEFIGEVLLDLSESIIDGTLVCYNLEDHDENSSPLPYRKKSFSISDTSAFTSFDDSSLATTPYLNPSPRSSIGGQRTSPQIMSISSAHERMRECMGQGKCSPGREFSSSNHSSPVLSPTSPTDQSPSLHKSSSFKSLVKQKMLSAMARMSSSINLGSDKKEHSVSYPNIIRCSSYHDVFDTETLDVIMQRPRKSFESAVGIYDLLAPPYPLSRSSSSSNFFLEMDQESDPAKCQNPDHPVPEGGDITSLLGPGQLPPKPSHEIETCGDIKMGFMVTKGKLEVDIAVVKGLSKSGISTPPDTYVKTYLVEGTKIIQKKKTQMVKASFDPVFRKKIKYSACNIHGRCIKVNVWEKQRTFNKKNCLGEAVVKLDNLNLSHFNLAWYKLFQMGAMDIGSSESLYIW